MNRQEIIAYLRRSLELAGPPGTKPNLLGMYSVGILHSALFLCGIIEPEDMPEGGDEIKELVEQLITKIERGMVIEIN